MSGYAGGEENELKILASVVGSKWTDRFGQRKLINQVGNKKTSDCAMKTII